METRHIIIAALIAAFVPLSCTMEKDDSYKQNPDPAEEQPVPGQAAEPTVTVYDTIGGMTFSREPGSTAYAFAGTKSTFEFAFDAVPESFDLKVYGTTYSPYTQPDTEFLYHRRKDNDYAYPEYGTTSRWNLSVQDGNSGTISVTLRPDDYSIRENCTFSYSFKLVVTPVIKVTEYPDGTVETEKGEPAEYEFFVRPYEITRFSLSDDIFSDVPAVITGEHNKTWMRRGFQFGARAGEEGTVTGLEYTANADIEDPDFDIERIAHIEFFNENYQKVGTPSWLETDGLTVRTAEDNLTDYPRWTYASVVLDEPFEGMPIFDIYSDRAPMPKLFVIRQLAEPQPKEGFVHFRDPELKDALVNGNSVRIDTDGDGEISPDEALAAKVIDIRGDANHDYYNIKDATGLEAFANLETLRINGHHDVTDLSVIGRFTRLNRLYFKECDKLEGDVDIRPCRTVFFQFDPPKTFSNVTYTYTTSLHIHAYRHQILGVHDILQGQANMVIWDDHKTSTDLSGSGEIVHLRDRTEPGNIVVVFMTTGFVDTDYQDGTSDDVFEYMMGGWKKCLPEHDGKTSFYYYKNVEPDRTYSNCWTGDTFDINKFKNDRNEWVKPIYEKFAIPNMDDDKFRLVVIETSLNGNCHSFVDPYSWFWDFNRAYREYGPVDCPGSTPMSVVWSYIPEKERRYAYLGMRVAGLTKGPEPVYSDDNDLDTDFYFIPDIYTGHMSYECLVERVLERTPPW